MENNIQDKPVVYKKSWFKRPLFYVLLVVLIGVGYCSYILGLAYNTITVDNGGPLVLSQKQIDEENERNPMPSEESDRLDILILGIRGENDLKNGGLLTDSMQVLSIDRKTNKAALIAIPRDLYVEMLGFHGKVNAVYEVGLAHGSGIAFVSQVVSRITGVYIDKTIVFDFKAFQNIVEELGGVDVYLTRPFSEKSQWGYEFTLPAGSNHLNGEQALYFVRSRYSTSDFDRAHRQQQVMTAIKNKAFSLGLATNPVKIKSLFDSLKGNIRTDFQIWDINNLLTLGSVFKNSNTIKNYVLSTDNLLYQTTRENGEYILLPKNDNYESLRVEFQSILK